MAGEVRFIEAPWAVIEPSLPKGPPGAAAGNAADQDVVTLQNVAIAELVKDDFLFC